MNTPLWDVSRLIPYALTLPDRRRVSPEVAAKGENYECPECGQILRLCAGESHHHRRSYFRHEEYQRPCAFREDGADRVLARHALLNAVMDKVEGVSDEAVTLLHVCRRCRIRYEQNLPTEVVQVNLKHWVKPASGEGHSRLADVALLDSEGHERCLIEIFRGREKPEFRFRQFTQTAWVILRAKPTLLEPHRLVVEAEGNFWECPTCKQLDNALRQRQENLKRREEDLKRREEAQTGPGLPTLRQRLEDLRRRR